MRTFLIRDGGSNSKRANLTTVCTWDRFGVGKFIRCVCSSDHGGDFGATFEVTDGLQSLVKLSNSQLQERVGA